MKKESIKWPDGFFKDSGNGWQKAVFELEGQPLVSYPGLYRFPPKEGDSEKWKYTFYHKKDSSTSIEGQFIAMMGFQYEACKKRADQASGVSAYNELCHLINLTGFKIPYPI